MNYGDFKKYVAAYLNRDADSLVINGVDILGQAINSAKQSAQRKYNFNILRTTGWIVANNTGTLVSEITTERGGDVTITVKKIEACWQVGETTDSKAKQVDFILSTDLKRLLPTLVCAQTDLQSLPVVLKNRCYVYGNKFFVTGLLTNDTFLLDIIQKLPDYGDAEDEDFFITDCVDWMLWKSLATLNGYLKETERIQVSKAMLDVTWDEIVAEDSELAGANDDTNTLD